MLTQLQALKTHPDDKRFVNFIQWLYAMSFAMKATLLYVRDLQPQPPQKYPADFYTWKSPSAIYNSE